jgi:hypothetical protein
MMRSFEPGKGERVPTPLLLARPARLPDGADDVEVLADEDVVRPADLDLWTAYEPSLSFSTWLTGPVLRLIFRQA